VLHGGSQMKKTGANFDAIRYAQIKAGQETYIPTWLRKDSAVNAFTSDSEVSHRTSKKSKSKSKTPKRQK